MTRTKKLLYTVSIDGGGVGTHIMRGPSARTDEIYQFAGVLLVDSFTSAGAPMLDIGYQSDQTYFTLNYFGQIDPVNGWSPRVPPSFASNQVRDPSLTMKHVGAIEQFVVVVSGAALTGGQLEFVLEAFDV